MGDYIIRSAVLEDVGFLTKVVIAADKGNSDMSSFKTLFDVSEQQATALLCKMFEEEVDGCEYSLSSFLICEFEGSPIAAFGGWIEGAADEMPSKVLKSNLIAYTFGTEKLNALKRRSGFISDLYIEREKETLQLEYLFVDDRHRGKGIADALIKMHIEVAAKTNADIAKAQVQLYKNNWPALKLYTRNGFNVLKIVRSENKDILQVFPCNEKILMEKHLKLST